MLEVRTDKGLEFIGPIDILREYYRVIPFV